MISALEALIDDSIDRVYAEMGEEGSSIEVSQQRERVRVCLRELVPKQVVWLLLKEAGELEYTKNQMLKLAAKLNDTTIHEE